MSISASQASGAYIFRAECHAYELATFVPTKLQCVTSQKPIIFTITTMTSSYLLNVYVFTLSKECTKKSKLA
jgi:hypothetical protein